MKPLLLTSLALWLLSCEFKADIKEKSPDGSARKIRNHIELQENGLKVSQAFLLYDDGTLVPETNLTRVNQTLHLRLLIDSGWTVQDGFVQIGGSEKVETSEGEVILEEADLFANQKKITEEDAKVISFRVVINNVSKLYDYYKVSFRLWDKISNASVSGSYKFNIQ